MSNTRVSDAAGDIKKDGNGDQAVANVAEVIAIPAPEHGVGSGLRESVTLALEAKELSLTPQQETALILLDAGRKRVEVAHAVGVSRQTLYKWMTKDAAFVVAYNTCVEDALATARARLVNGLDTATETVLRGIRTNENLAYKFVHDAGAMKFAYGTLNVEELKAELELAAKKKKVERRREEDELERL